MIRMYGKVNPDSKHKEKMDGRDKHEINIKIY